VDEATVLTTARLSLRRLSSRRPEDLAFVLDLVNEPSWIRFIGDRGVRTLDDARGYLEKGPEASYAKNGFGLWLVERKDDGAPLGMTGLIKRDGLADVDIGFAFFPRYWGQGYAREAAEAVLAHATRDLGMRRVVAITSRDNHASQKVLLRIGMRHEGTVKLPGDDEELDFFATVSS
jgi:RimJ/RimL family protein N-acetyltransferase